jgi:hypothetical protein
MANVPTDVMVMENARLMICAFVVEIGKAMIAVNVFVHLVLHMWILQK